MITDGIDNRSCEYTRDEVKMLVKSAKSFIDIKYVGSNQNTGLVAGGLGITDSLAYKDDLIRHAIRSTSEAVSRRRSGQDSNFTKEDRERSTVIHND